MPAAWSVPNPRHLQVLRALHARRHATTGQLADAFRDRSPRVCQRALAAWERDQLVLRIRRRHGGWGGGREDDAFALTNRGAALVAAELGLAPTEIPLATDAWEARVGLLNAHLAVNRYVQGRRDALQAQGYRLASWGHSQSEVIRFRWRRGWAAVHPTALLAISRPGDSSTAAPTCPLRASRKGRRAPQGTPTEQLA